MEGYFLVEKGRGSVSRFVIMLQITTSLRDEDRVRYVGIVVRLSRYVGENAKNR